MLGEYLDAIIENLQKLSSIASWIAVIAAIATLFFAIQTLREVHKEVDLFTKFVYGEIYEVAQVEKTEFFIPPIALYKISGYPQSEKPQVLESIQLQNNTPVEFFLNSVLKEKQHIRSLTVGFGLGKNTKPLVTERTGGFAAKQITSFIREEYVDWDGNYHIEYAHPRTVPKGESVLVSFKAETGDPGKYQLTIAMFTDEAVKPYKKELNVIVV